MARARSNKSDRGREILGLVALAVAALTAISLLSFDPLDSSFFSHSTKTHRTVVNLAGTVGANISHGLLVVVGLFAYVVPAVLVLVGLRKLMTPASAVGGRRGRAVGSLLLWLSLSALLAILVGNVEFAGNDGSKVLPVSIPAGGLVGTFTAAPLGRWLGPAGSLIILLTTLFGSLLLTTPLSFARAIEGGLERTGGAWNSVRTRTTRWYGHWQSERQRRRALMTEHRAEQQRLATVERERQEQEHAAVQERQAAEQLLLEQQRADEALRLANERESERENEQKYERAIHAAARAATLRLGTQPTPLSTASAPAPAVPGPAVPIPAAAAVDRAALPLSPVPSATLGTTVPNAPIAHAPLPDLASRRRAAAAAATTSLGLGAMRTADVPIESLPGPADDDPELQRMLADTDGTADLLADDLADMAARAALAMRQARAGAAIPPPTRTAHEAAVAPTPQGTAPADPGPGLAISARRGRLQGRSQPEDFELPPLSLLETVTNDDVVGEQELVEHAKTLVSKLKEFSVDGTVQAIHPGPVVTTYEYRPEPGVKYSKIVGLADDLCLAMKAEGVRIDRISGKSAIGIEVPNSIRETIGLRELLETDAFARASSKLSMAIGKDINGGPYFTDLRKMPHLLIAGATGAGKSVAVNCMIVSILYKAKPEDVRFIMVDPKRIELGVYDGIPHLLVPVVTDARLASNALRWAVTEMENRYKKLAGLGVRSLDQYNSYMRGPEAKKLAKDLPPEELLPLPYIVILIDELADLMMVAANDVEDSISRLAAMARAVGIHLVLATQRPSVDVITGVIKANFPSRLAFRVSSKVDSRTILDSNGAEMLLGKGDGLFMPPGSARLLRLHGGFISDGEVQRLVNYLKNQGEPEYDDKILKAPQEERGEIEGEIDEMYEEAVRVVLETGQASVSMLQRRLRLGYGRAARLVDVMELNGIVGPSQGSKGRDILVDRDAYLAQLAG